MAGFPGIIIKIGSETRDAIQGINKVDKAIGKAAGRSRKATAVMSAGWTALGVGAVAAGAAFVKVAGDAIEAAIEEEQSLTVLHKTMENLGLAAANSGVDKFIDDLQFSANVADNKLRPAFDRLIRSTGDVAEAQKATALVTDIAATKGRDVLDVANALGKAYDGNTGALGKMGLGLDNAILKSHDMAAITAELTTLFGGQAEAQGDTLGGAIAGVKIAVDELSESFGKGLVGATDDSVAALKDAEAQLRSMQPAVEDLGGDVNKVGLGALTTYDNFKTFLGLLNESDWSTAMEILKTGVTGTDEEMRTLINSTKGESDAINAMVDRWNAVAAAAASAKAIAASSGVDQWSAADAYNPTQQALNMDFDARQRAAKRAARAARKAAAAAAAKAAADSAAYSAARVTRAAESRSQASALDLSYLDGPWSPTRSNRNRKIMERRADGRAAQRDARTGGRP